MSWPEAAYAARFSTAPQASIVVVNAIGRPNLTWSPASNQPPVRSSPTSEPSRIAESPRQDTRFQAGLRPDDLGLVEEQRLLQRLAVAVGGRGGGGPADCLTQTSAAPSSDGDREQGQGTGPRGHGGSSDRPRGGGGGAGAVTVIVTWERSQFKSDSRLQKSLGGCPSVPKRAKNPDPSNYVFGTMRGYVMSSPPDPPDPSELRNFSRRGFIATVGAGTAGAVALGRRGAGRPGPGRRPVRRLRHSRFRPSLATPADRFGRMFPDLPPFVPANDRNRAALIDIGKPGGILDAKDPLAAGPVQLITDPALSANNRNNPEHTAGMTFLGQFLDHDMTFDTDLAAGRADRAGVDAEHPHARRSTSTRCTAAGRPASPQLYEPRPRQAADRDRRPVRGPAAQRQRHRDHRRPAQRREPDHLRPAGRVHPGPQPRSSTGCAARACRPTSVFDAGPAARHLALPVDHRQRVPAADHRPGAGQRHPHQRPAVVPARARAGVSRWSSRARRTGSGTAWSARRTGLNLAGNAGRHARSSASSSTRPARARPTRSTCAAARGPGGGSSAGRRSSTSAATRPSTCGRTSGSTRRSPRRCSTCRSAPSPAATRRPRCRSATCCAT